MTDQPDDEGGAPPKKSKAILFGAVGSSGHFCLTRAISIADATSVMPYDYLRLPFVALIAYIAFGEVADLWVWLGGGLIAGSAIYAARSDAAAAGGEDGEKAPASIGSEGK